MFALDNNFLIGRLTITEINPTVPASSKRFQNNLVSRLDKVPRNQFKIVGRKSVEIIIRHIVITPRLVGLSQVFP